MLTTGVDVPTCRNVAIVRNVGAMTEFKQIIGRGTRVREDCGKLYFNILDYTGAATRLFADPDFDGEPAFIEDSEINDEGETTATTITEPEPPTDEQSDLEQPKIEPPTPEQPETPDGPTTIIDEPPSQPRKFYVDGGGVEIAATVVYRAAAASREPCLPSSALSYFSSAFRRYGSFFQRPSF